MKTILACILLMSFAVQGVASLTMVTAYQKGDDVVLMFQGRQVSHDQLRQDLAKLATIHPALTIFVRTDNAVSLSNVLSIMKCIKSVGFRNVVLLSNGSYNNERGTFLFPIQMKTNAVSLTHGYIEPRDFVSDSRPPDIGECQSVRFSLLSGLGNGVAQDQVGAGKRGRRRGQLIAERCERSGAVR